MITVAGNLWTYQADARCITTNGFVKRSGEAVMGRGCAKQATKRYPGIQRLLGDSLKLNGNHVVEILPNLYTFPVKHHWMDGARVDLIAQSAKEISELFKGSICVIPRPGCGNGGLLWQEVEPILQKLLDDRFHIIDFERLL